MPMPYASSDTQAIVGSLRALLPGLRREFPLHGMAYEG